MTAKSEANKEIFDHLSEDNQDFSSKPDIKPIVQNIREPICQISTVAPSSLRHVRLCPSQGSAQVAINSPVSVIAGANGLAYRVVRINTALPCGAHATSQHVTAQSSTSAGTGTTSSAHVRLAAPSAGGEIGASASAGFHLTAANIDQLLSTPSFYVIGSATLPSALSTHIQSQCQSVSTQSSTSPTQPSLLPSPTIASRCADTVPLTQACGDDPAKPVSLSCSPSTLARASSPRLVTPIPSSSSFRPTVVNLPAGTSQYGLAAGTAAVDAGAAGGGGTVGFGLVATPAQQLIVHSSDGYLGATTDTDMCASPSQETTMCPTPGAGMSLRGDARRRATHNEIERRRRDKINNWIAKLSKLLSDTGGRSHEFNKSKGAVLAHACYFISEAKSVQQKCMDLARENARLQEDVKLLKQSNDALVTANQLLKVHLKGNPLIDAIHMPTSTASSK